VTDSPDQLHRPTGAVSRQPVIRAIARNRKPVTKRAARTSSNGADRQTIWNGAWCVHDFSGDKYTRPDMNSWTDGFVPGFSREPMRDMLLVFLAAIWMGCSSSPANPKPDGGGVSGHTGVGGTAGGAGTAGGGGAGGAGGAVGAAGTSGLGGSAGRGGASDGGGSGGPGGVAGEMTDGGGGGAAGAAGSGAGGGPRADGGGAGAGGAGGSGAAGAGTTVDSGTDDGGVDGCASGDLAGIGVPAGTVATASGYTVTGFTPDKAIDGDTTTRWNAGTNTGWIMLTFPAPVAMSAVRIHAHALPDSIETYIVTQGSSTTAIGSEMVDVPPAPGIVLPDIQVTPGSYSSITITVSGAVAWVNIYEIWLLPFACH